MLWVHLFSKALFRAFCIPGTGPEAGMVQVGSLRGIGYWQWPWSIDRLRYHRALEELTKMGMEWIKGNHQSRSNRLHMGEKEDLPLWKSVVLRVEEYERKVEKSFGLRLWRPVNARIVHRGYQCENGFYIHICALLKASDHFLFPVVNSTENMIHFYIITLSLQNLQIPPILLAVSQTP